VKAIRRFTVRVALPEPLAPLLGLMLNLRWSWHGPAADLFASIDPDAWQASGGDPIAMLSALPPDRISVLAGDAEFLGRLHEAERGLREYMSGPRWFAGLAAQTGAGSGPSAVAYFSPEYGITAALPQSLRRWRTSRPSTASPPRCRSTPAAWASWPGIT